MTTLIATVPYKSVSLSARVIRANGEVEELGVIGYWHANPLRRWAWAIGQFIKGKS